MIHYAEYDQDGRYLSRGIVLREEDAAPQQGGAIFFGEVDPLRQYHDIVTDTPTDFPGPPAAPEGVVLSFNPATREWEVEIDRSWAAVRVLRDRRLAETDWVTLRAQEHGTPVPPEWLTYRQALRDITEQPDPFSIVWPAAPG